MRLNGWQRLLVLIGIIYLMFILLVYAFVIRPIFPTEGDIYRNWYKDLYFYASLNGSDEFKNISPEDLKAKYDMDEKKLVDLIESGLRPKTGVSSNGIIIPSDAVILVEVDKIREKYLDDIDRMSKINVKLIVMLLWGFPLIILYIFGCLVAWVYRGFNQKL